MVSASSPDLSLYSSTKTARYWSSHILWHIVTCYYIIFHISMGLRNLDTTYMMKIILLNKLKQISRWFYHFLFLVANLLYELVCPSLTHFYFCYEITKKIRSRSPFRVYCFLSLCFSVCLLCMLPLWTVCPCSDTRTVVGKSEPNIGTEELKKSSTYR